jgi:heme A synthase
VSLGELYLFLQPIHYWLSRIGLAAAVIMFAAGVYIGILRRGDVTRWFRRAVYLIAGTMAFQAATGAVMYFVIGVRPAEEVHLIYGLGSLLALPFFIFVEVTAKKRPAMGSYIWGFAVLAGVLVRSITTGAWG